MHLRKRFIRDEISLRIACVRIASFDKSSKNKNTASREDQNAIKTAIGKRRAASSRVANNIEE